MFFGEKYQRYNILIFLANLLFATAVCWGVSGALPRLHDVFLIWCLINCLWLKPIWFWLSSPLLLAWLLFSPIGFQYGYPNSGMIASLLETNVKEAGEFFDPLTITYMLILVIFAVLIFYINKNLVATQKQRQFFKWFSITLAVFFIGNQVYIWYKDQAINLSFRYTKLIDIFPHTLKHYHFYLENRQKMQQIQGLKSDWQVVSFQPKYQNHVLVIGESASKNYLSAYGYPIKTSPFLEMAYGTKYTQAIAPAGYTTKSVPRLLTIPNDKEVEYQNNIVDLANQLGFDTYWLSNQDKLGPNENEIAYIATKVQHEYYLSEKQPTSARYDYQLLPQIQQALADSSDKPKFIIIHLMGSHGRFINRVDTAKPHFNFDDDYLSDYLSSIRQTDLLLEQIYQALQQTNQSFSMVYLPDHGLTPIKLKHGATQFSLQIPLFKLSSDDKEQTVDDRVITGLGFVWFLTDWLGITTENQQKNTFIRQYDVSSLDKVKIFNDTMKNYTELESFDGQLLMPKPSEMRDIHAK